MPTSAVSSPWPWTPEAERQHSDREQSSHVEREQHEWEQQLRVLDQREVELHQGQAKLIREQFSSCIRDLTTLQEEVRGLRRKQETLTTDVATALRAAVDEIGQAHRLAQGEQQARQESVLARLTDLEAQLRNNQAIGTAAQEGVSVLQQKVLAWETETAPLLDELKVALRNDAAEQIAVQSRLEERMQELSGAVGEVKRAQHRCAEQQAALDAGHATLLEMLHGTGERMEAFENVVGELAEKHTGELRAAAAELEHIKRRVATSESHLTTVHGLERSVAASVAAQANLEAECASLRDRIGRLEASMSQSNIDTGSRLEHEMKSLDTQQSSLIERLRVLERTVAEVVREHQDGLTSALGRIEELDAKVLEDRGRLEGNVAALDALRKSHVGQAAIDKMDLDRQIASMQERLAHIEGSSLEVTEGHERQLQDLKLAHASISGDVKAKERLHASLAERLDQLRGSVDQVHGRLEHLGGSVDRLGAEAERLSHHSDEAARQRTTLMERVDYLETALGKSADRQSRDLQSLKEAHEQHSHDLDILRTSCEQNVSLADRVATLEAFASSSKAQRSQAQQEVAALQGRVQELVMRASEDRATMEANRDGVHAQFEAAQNQHATIAHRVEQLEASLARELDRQTKEAHAAKSAHEQLAADMKAQLSVSAERYTELDQQLVHAKAWGEQLATALARLELLPDRVAACETTHGAALTELKEALTVQQARCDTLTREQSALRERMEELAAAAHRTEERNDLALEALRTAQARILSEAKAKESHEAEVVDRIARIDEQLRGTSQSLAAQAADHKSTHGRLELRCGDLASALGDLKSSLAGQAAEMTSMTSNASSLKEKVERLEHGFHDHREKSTRESQGIQTKLDQLHTRVSACERHGTSFTDLDRTCSSLSMAKEELKAGHLSLQERVDSLEALLGATADAHSKEVQSLKAAHSRLTSESSARAANTSSVGDRVKALADECRELFRKVEADLAAGNAKTEQVHGLVMEERRMRESHVMSFEMLKKAVANQAAQERGALEKLEAATAERFEYIEQLVGDSADSHSKELDSLRAAHGKMVGEEKTKEWQYAALAERVAQLVKHMEEANSLHESLRQHAERLEVAVSDDARRYEREFGAFREAHSQHLRDVEAWRESVKQDLQVAVPDRLSKLEQHVSDIERQRTQEAAAVQARLKDLTGAVNQERDALEAHKENVRDHLSTEREAIASLQTHVRQQLDRLQHAAAEDAQRQKDDIQSLKLADSRLAMELKAHETERASNAEHLSGIERRLLELSNLGIRLEEATARLADLHMRLSAAEAHGVAAVELKQALAALSREHEALAARHEGAQGQLAALDRLVAEGGHQSARTMESLRTAQDRIASEWKSQVSQLESVVQARFARLEQDAVEAAKHRAEVETALADGLGDLRGKLAELKHQQTADAKKVQALMAGTQEKAILSSQLAALSARLEALDAASETAASRAASAAQALQSQLEHLLVRIARTERTTEQLARSTGNARGVGQERAELDHLASRVSAVESALQEVHGQRGGVEGAGFDFTPPRRAAPLESAFGAGAERQLAEMSVKLRQVEKRSLNMDAALENLASRISQLEASRLEAPRSPLHERPGGLQPFGAQAMQQHLEELASRLAALEDAQCEAPHPIARASSRLAIAAGRGARADTGEADLWHLEELSSRLTALEDAVGKLQQPAPGAAGRTAAAGGRIASAGPAEAMQEHFEDLASRMAALEEAMRVQLDELASRVAGLEDAQAKLQRPARSAAASGRGAQAGYAEAMQEHLEDLASRMAAVEEAQQKLQQLLPSTHARLTAAGGRGTQPSLGQEQLEGLGSRMATVEEAQQKLQQLVPSIHTQLAAADARGAPSSLGEDTLTHRPDAGSPAAAPPSYVAERVSALERAVVAAEARLSKEIEERKSESSRMWKAISLSTGVGPQKAVEAHVPGKRRTSPRFKHMHEEEPEEEDDGEYLPFPWQPLTSFLRLGHAANALSDIEDDQEAFAHRGRRKAQRPPQGGGGA